MKSLLCAFLMVASGCISSLYAMEKNVRTVVILMPSLGVEPERLFHDMSFSLNPEKVYSTRIKNNSLLSLVDRYAELIECNRAACLNEKDPTSAILTKAFLEALAIKFRSWITLLEGPERNDSEPKVDYTQNISAFEKDFSVIGPKLIDNVHTMLRSVQRDLHEALLSGVLFKLEYSPAFQLFIYSPQVKKFLANELSLIKNVIKSITKAAYIKNFPFLPPQDLKVLKTASDHCFLLRLESELLSDFDVAKPDCEESCDSLEKDPLKEYLKAETEMKSQAKPGVFLHRYDPSFSLEDGMPLKRKENKSPEREDKAKRKKPFEEDKPVVSFEVRTRAFEVSKLLSQLIPGLDVVKLQTDLSLNFNQDKLKTVQNFLLLHQHDLDSTISSFIAYKLCLYADHEAIDLFFEVIANSEGTTLCLDIIHYFSKK